MDASDKTFPPDDRRAPIVEATVECAAGNSIVSCGFLQRFQVLGAQLGIGVVKAEERPARFGSSSIHLSAARGFVAGNQADEASTVQLAKAFARPNGSHHPLSKFWGDWQTGHEINDEVFILPDRNDQAEQWIRYAAISCGNFWQHLGSR
jgi:hypothetical protein